MKFNLKEIIQTATFKESSITFIGTVINGVLGLLFLSFTASVLQPVQYGLFVLATTVLILVSDIFDFGVRSGLVRYVSKNLKENKKQQAFKFLKFTLEFKLAVGIITALVGWIISPILASSFFQKTELAMPLRLAFIGIFFLSAYSFSIASLQAFQRFWIWSGLQIGTNFLRLLIVLFLASVDSLNLTSSMLVYILIPLMGFLACFLFIPSDFLKVKEESKVRNELFHYSKWIGAFVILAAISSRLDIFIVGKLLSTAEVGIYGVAAQLAMIVPQVIVAISTVIAPKMSQMGSKKELIEYYKKTQILTFGLALLGLSGIPIAYFLVPIFFGQAFIGAVPIFAVLLSAMLVFLISIPIHNVIIYYYGYPKLFFWLSIGHILIISILGWILTSQFGLMGTAFTVLIGTIFNFIIPLIWGLKKLNEK